MRCLPSPSSLRTALWLWLRRGQARLCTALLTRSSGQGLVEYGLILALIAVVVIGIMTLLGQTVSGLWYQRIVDALDDILG